MIYAPVLVVPDDLSARRRNAAMSIFASNGTAQFMMITAKALPSGKKPNCLKRKEREPTPIPKASMPMREEGEVTGSGAIKNATIRNEPLSIEKSTSPVNSPFPNGRPPKSHVRTEKVAMIDVG
jgi:hypothetical protein